jgi:hypothetical protein
MERQQVTDVGLKEVMEQQLRDLREQVFREIRHERELRESWITSTEAALELKNIETERRLDNLNHEQARVALNAATYLSRDIFFTWRDGFEKEKAIAAEEAARALGAAEARETASRRMWGVVVAVGSVLLNMIYGLFTGKGKP